MTFARILSLVTRALLARPLHLELDRSQRDSHELVKDRIDVHTASDNHLGAAGAGPNQRLVRSTPAIELGDGDHEHRKQNERGKHGERDERESRLIQSIEQHDGSSTFDKTLLSHSGLGPEKPWGQRCGGCYG